MQNGLLCVYVTHTKKDANGMTCNTHTLSISIMLTITILANDIIYEHLYYVNIFQNTHIAAYGRTQIHTPPKVSIQSWINVTQLAESKTRAM